MKKKEVERILELFPAKVSKGDRRRAEIINATIECISTLGWASTSYDAIGKKLGIGRAHVAYYFKKKNDLFLHAFKYVTATAQEQTREEIQRAKNFNEQYLASAIGAFKWYQKNPKQVSVLLAFYYQCSVNKKFKSLHTSVRQTGQRRLRDHLEQRFSKPRSAQIASSYQSLVMGTIVELFTTGLQNDLPRAKRDLVSSLMCLLNS